MKKYCFIAIALVLLSCTSNHKQPATPNDADEKKTDSFFPVTSFIKGQLTILDSLPVTPLQITTIKGKTDSAWISKQVLRSDLQPFITPEIGGTNFIKYFKETRFVDQTLHAVTFTYDLINKIPDSIPLRHWDVYIDPETGNIMKVYIVKDLKEKDQIFTQQLTWQTNKMAKISTILNKPDGNMELLKEVVFMWGFDPVN